MNLNAENQPEKPLTSANQRQDNAQIIGIKELSNSHFILEWDDGQKSTFESRELRFQCPCASCVHEWSGKRLILKEQIPVDVHPIAIESVGNYAIQITWSDRHRTGIYTFQTLKSLAAKDSTP